MQSQKPKKENSDIEVIGVNYFFNKFELEKRRYHPSLFSVKTKSRAKQKVSLALYKKIILEFLKFYFFDFYMSNRAVYFPLGGYLKKVGYRKWIKKMRRGQSEEPQQCGSEGAIGLFWYMRPSKKMFYMVTLKKLTGSSNRLPKIEEIYKDNFNKDLLPIFKSEYQKSQKNKTLFLCTLT